MLRNKPLKDFKEIICDAESITRDSLFYLTSDSSEVFQRLAGRSAVRSHSGHYSVKLNNEHQYALAMTLEDLQACDKIWATVWRFPVGSPGAIVFQSDESADDFYHSELYNVTNRSENGWEQLSAHITIPENFTGGSIDFFLQNPGNEELWFDDLKITIVKF